MTVAGTGPWTALVAVLVTGQGSCRGELQGLLVVGRSSGKRQRENRREHTRPTEYYVIGGFRNQFQLQKNLFQVNGTMAGPHWSYNSILHRSTWNHGWSTRVYLVSGWSHNV